MEIFLGVLVGGAALVTVLLLIVARRSRNRSTLDPSKDLYGGVPRGTEVHPTVFDWEQYRP
ncbi:hypothetical protein ACFQY4_40370 [Catellatospora bangladeshensis]|uniref:Uncharacterized protein n=1 Tax=Catellatospora bangladeshensis TaxID=310355 RepID=A0A8J3JVB8_9ACTN|nr:hypothetical protein [Catellatospora bangladeshensis]GIF83784.1 hypothetical protein Cba03nite_51330 [Catellatospora bangladeshensis]